jgi:hypothetical protein
MEIIKNHQFKQQLYLFMCFTFIFQCLLYFNTLADSFHSFQKLIQKDQDFLNVLLEGFFKMTFIFVYLFYWLVCSCVLSIPGFLLSRWPRVASTLTIFLLFIFTIYSKIDFFILNHYQFHLGSDILSWFVDKKYPLFVNLQIFHDLGLSFQELCFVFSLLCIFLLIFIGMMSLSAYLVKQYDFQEHVIYFNIYLIFIKDDIFKYIIYFQFLDLLKIPHN